MESFLVTKLDKIMERTIDQIYSGLNGQLQVDVAGSVQVTGMVTVVCHSNSAAATLTRNVDLSH